VAVWTVWALPLAGALAFVGTFGRNIPLADEWVVMVPVLTGEQALTPAWLWHQHNEHRIPLPKLLLLTLCRLTGNDFRAGMVVNVLALGALAALLIRAARRCRGWTSYPDAFFPLALLHGGHAFNLLVDFQVQLVASTVLAGLVLVLMVRPDPPATLAGAPGAGSCLLLLPLCGANGLLLVPLFTVWLAHWADRCWRLGQRQGKRTALVLVALAAVTALLLVCACLYRYEKPVNFPVSPSLGASVLIGAHFASLGFGAAAGSLWPVGGVLVLTGGPLTCAVTAAAWYRRTREPGPAFNLTLFLAALLGLALILGWGRAGRWPEVGYVYRYTTLVVPLLCGIHLAWAVVGRPRLGRGVQWGLFLLMAAAFGPNLQEALAVGHQTCELRESFGRDVQAGHSIPRLAKRYTQPEHMLAADELVLAHELRGLRRAEIGLYRHLPEVPAVAEPGEDPADPAGAWVGGLDPGDALVLTGWACDPHQPSQTLAVAVFDGDTWLATIRRRPGAPPGGRLGGRPARVHLPDPLGPPRRLSPHDPGPLCGLGPRPGGLAPDDLPQGAPLSHESLCRISLS
jgi:hypothetical protein